MSIARRPHLVTLLAFAGALIWSGAVANPSAAAETAALPHFNGCTPLTPRFEPNPLRGAHLAPETTSFPGGAKLRSLVGEPCLQGSHPRDV